MALEKRKTFISACNARGRGQGCELIGLHVRGALGYWVACTSNKRAVVRRHAFSACQGRAELSSPHPPPPAAACVCAACEYGNTRGGGVAAAAAGYWSRGAAAPSTGRSIGSTRRSFCTHSHGAKGKIMFSKEASNDDGTRAGAQKRTRMLHCFADPLAAGEIKFFFFFTDTRDGKRAREKKKPFCCHQQNNSWARWESDYFCTCWKSTSEMRWKFVLFVVPAAAGVGNFGMKALDLLWNHNFGCEHEREKISLL